MSVAIEIATCSVVLPAGMCPGQRITAGIRSPPSRSSVFRPMNGYVSEKRFPPLSLVKMTIVLLASGDPLGRRHPVPSRTSCPHCAATVDPPKGVTGVRRRRYLVSSCMAADLPHSSLRGKAQSSWTPAVRLDPKSGPVKAR